MKGILAVVVITLMLTGEAAAGSLEDAKRALANGDYKTGMRLLRPLAEQGVADAQYFLGYIYKTRKSYAEALKWMRLAAEQGDAVAQNNLGVMYTKGKGVPQDYVLAHMWFNLSASRPMAFKEERDQTLGRDRRPSFVDTFPWHRFPFT